MASIKKILNGKSGKTIFKNDYGRISFGQYGEDMLLVFLFSSLVGDIDKYAGFYVDLGAHHPFLHSNTALLNMLNWRGVNVDACADSIQLFRRHRPNDINVVAGVSDKNETQTFYFLEGGGMNTFDLLHLTESAKKRIYKTEVIECQAVNELLRIHVPPQQQIDYLNIDLEGFDEKVLQAIDFQQYRPSVISIELLGWGVLRENHISVIQYLNSLEYELFSRCGITSIFIDTRRFSLSD